MDTFTVLAEPSRRRLLQEMQPGPQSVSHLVERSGMSQPVVSKHLRILRDARFVTVTPVGQRRMYQLNPHAFRELDSWLQPYRSMWASRLDKLEALLDEPHERRQPR